MYPNPNNDADLEMMELDRQANAMSRAEKVHGICFHGWTGPGDKPGSRKCLYCGKQWPNDDAAMAEYNELKAEYC